MDQFKITDYPTSQADDTVIVRDLGNIYLFNKDEIRDTLYGSYLQDVCTFAQLCAESYVDEHQTEKNHTLKKNEEPQRWQQRANDAGWEKQAWQAPALSSGFNIKSLKYTLWIDQQHNRAVVVFRGTASAADWWSNAHWLTRFVPGVNNHYKQVHAMVKPAIEFLRTKLGNDFDLYTTGHSLGGGLAQLFAYSSPLKATLVSAFHSSPVTGYFQIPAAKRKQAAEGLFIARVFEHGEILAYPRLLLRKFYPVTTGNPRISEYRTNFTKGGIVTQHSMATFADTYYSILKE